MEMDNNIRFEKESCRNLKSHFEELWKLDSPAYRIAVCGCSNAKIPTLIFVLLHFLATLSAAVFLMSVTIPAVSRSLLSFFPFFSYFSPILKF